MDDRELLQAYILRQSDAAFTELVQRHAGLVYGTALRVVRNPQTAQDVAQAVFIRLAQKAWTVRDGRTLSAWLHRVAFREACSIVRRENRRRLYEAEAMKLADHTEPPPTWEHLQPLLDEALRRLSRSEQNVVILRYLENQPLEQVSAALDITEAAVRMRANRAVEKIRAHLARRGLAVTASALATVLSANACSAAPAGLAASVAQASLANVAGAGALSHFFWKFFFMTTKTKIVAAVAIVGVLAIPLEIQREKISRLEARLAQETNPPPVEAVRRLAAKGDGSPHSLPWDLRGPLAEILKKYPGGARIPALVKLVEQTPVSGLAQLLNEAANCPDAGARDLLEELVYSKWVAANPPAALAYALAKPAPANRAAADRVFAEWAGQDPQKALGAALNLPQASLRTASVTQIFSTWAKRDPQAALAALPDLPPSRLKSDLWQTVAKQWAQQDPVGAWTASGNMERAGQRNVFQDLIVQNLAGSDPQKAFELFSQFPMGNQRLRTFTQIFQKWGAQDPAAAFAALQQLPAGEGRSNATQSVFAGWAELNPEAALKGAQNLPPGHDREVAEMTSLRSLAAQNPQAAGEYISTLPSGNNRTNLTLAFTEAWADRDAAAAWAWVKDNTVGNTFNAAAVTVLTRMSEEHPQESLGYILQLPEGQKRDQLLETAASNWASFDSSATAAWAKQNLEGSDLATILAGVAMETSYVDPMSATDLVSQVPAGPARDEAIANIALRISSLDAGTAAQWLQNLPADMADGPRLAAYVSVINKWAGLDPAAAAAYVQNFANDPKLSTLANRVAKAWAQSDGLAALKWADSLPAGKAREEAVASSLSAWAIADSAAAWNYAQNLPASDSNNRLLSSLATTWSKADPAAAASAVSAIPGESPAQLVGIVATNYLHEDPLAASRWINTLPPGLARDTAVSSLISVEGRNDLPSAFNWAVTIGDATMQGNQLEAVLRQWAVKDPQAAAAAVQSANVSSQLRERLLNSLQATPRPPQN